MLDCIDIGASGLAQTVYAHTGAQHTKLLKQAMMQLLLCVCACVCEGEWDVWRERHRLQDAEWTQWTEYYNAGLPPHTSHSALEHWSQTETDPNSRQVWRNWDWKCVHVLNKRERDVSCWRNREKELCLIFSPHATALTLCDKAARTNNQNRSFRSRADERCTMQPAPDSSTWYKINNIHINKTRAKKNQNRSSNRKKNTQHLMTKMPRIK